MGLKQRFTQTNVAPNLEPEKASQVAKLSTSKHGQVEYNVKGTAPVAGSKLLVVPDLPVDDAQGKYLVGNGERMLLNNQNNSQPRGFSEQVSLKSVGDMINVEGVDRFTAYKSKKTNAGILLVSIAEDVFYLDSRLYNTQNGIDSGSYSDGVLNAKIAGMINASKDEYNAKARRIARLAKAFKDGVIAQTNDTNPFYDMDIGEIYDRLVDHFANTAHSVCAIKTAEFWLKVRPLLVNGDLKFQKIYEALYTSDFCALLEDAVAKAKSSMIGQYYDRVSLSEALTLAVPGLASKQSGATRLVIPQYGPNTTEMNSLTFDPGVCADPFGSHAMLPHIDPTQKVAIETQQQYILAFFKAITERTYAADASIIQTALASFNGVEIITDIKDSGMEVKTALLNMINANVQYAAGALQVITKVTKHGITVVTPSWLAEQANITWTHFGNNYYMRGAVAGTILNYNGYTSIVSFCPYKNSVTKELKALPDHRLTPYGEGGHTGFFGASGEYVYGQSIMTMKKMVVAAPSLANHELVNIADAQYDYDILHGADIAIQDVDDNDRVVTREKEFPWSGVKYKFNYGQALKDYTATSLFVAHALIHNGDTVVRASPTSFNPDERKVSGYCSIAKCMDVAGNRDRVNDDAKCASQNLNTLSLVDNYIIVCTPTWIETTSDQVIKAYATNVTDGFGEWNTLNNDASPDYIDSIMSSIMNLGVIISNRPNLVTFGGYTFDKAGAGMYSLFDIFDGPGYYLLDKEYHVGSAKAQYMYGLTSYEEEFIITSK